MSEAPRLDPTTDRVRRGLAVGLGGMTALHLAAPRPFEELIPDELPGSTRVWHGVAIAAEATSSALLARRSTARAGGVAALLTFLAVWVGNLEAVRQGGYDAAPGWFGSRDAAIMRLPLQLPLLWLAWRVATAGTDPAGR